MSQVIVRYDPSFLNSQELERLSLMLPSAVAKHLSVPGTSAVLRPEEVEVEFREAGKFDVLQRHRLTITIEANAYPERQQILEAANEAIAVEIIQLFALESRGYIPSGWVWTRLAPAAFHELR